MLSQSGRWGAGKSFAILIIGMLAMSGLLILPNGPRARAQTTETTVNEHLPASYYNATEIQINSVSVLAYVAASNTTVGTAIMSPAQFGAYIKQFDFNNSLYSQVGTESYNALLATPGLYYLVELTGNSPAQINQTYIIDPDIAVSNSTTSVGEFLTIPADNYLYLPLHRETVGAPFELDIFGASNGTIQYSVFDNVTDSFNFHSPFVTVANFTVIPTVSEGYNISLGEGIYYLVLNNTNPYPVYTYFQYTIVPQYVNPYIFNHGAPAPTGIAAYGLYNSSGTITTYTVESNAIVGFAEITSIMAQDKNPSTGAVTDLASLQLNNVLQVTNADNSTFTYWPQNVIAFNTGSGTIGYHDNVLNLTGDFAQLSNQTISGEHGFVSEVNNSGILQTYYGNYLADLTYSYSLPLALVLYMNESLVSGQGVQIQMGVQRLGSANTNVTWYDKIMIVDPDISSASFVVKGNGYTQAGIATLIGQFYDSELIFGGGAGGQAATFSSLSAKLSLFYENQTLKPFPSLYTFGVDTAEAAYNIDVTAGDGYASLQAGTPTFSDLTNNFNSSLVSLEAQAKQSSSTTSSSYLVIGGVAVVAVVVVLVFALSRRRASRGPGVMMPPAPPTTGPPATAFCGNCGAPLEAGTQFCPNCGQPVAQQAPPSAAQ